MNNSSLRALDIALATEARAMYAHLLSQEDKEKIAALHSADELVAFLGRSEAWRPASLALPPIGATDEQFSEALYRCLFDDYERPTASRTTPRAATSSSGPMRWSSRS